MVEEVFPEISADSVPSMKGRPFAAGVEVQIVQCFDCVQDSPDRIHLAVVDQSVASTSDVLGGDEDGTSGHRTASGDTNAGTPNGDGMEHASNTDC